MARTADYKSAFDIIGPIMIGPSSSHTAGAVRIGKAAREILEVQPEKINITYYESFAETHLGHGTDLAIIGGLLDFDTEDPRIRTSIDIAKQSGIDIEFVEEQGPSLGDHPNCALVKINTGEMYVELLGISIGGGTIKIKSININGTCVLLNHTLPLLVLHGHEPRSTFSECINEMMREGLDINEEMKAMNDDHLIVVLHLNKPIHNELLEKITADYPAITFSNLI